MRADFTASALLLAWLVIAALVVVVANLALRVQRLEQATPGAGDLRRHPGFGHVTGTPLGDLLPSGQGATTLVVLLAPACRTCERLVGELSRGDRFGLPVLLAATRPVGGAPEGVPHRGRGAVVPGGMVDGRAIAERLGVRVTPFAVVVGPDGRVVAAGTVTERAHVERLIAAHTATDDNLEQERS